MIYLLDCTLRDGGYKNDWNFGYNNIVTIFERLVDANLDMIEVGFLDERRKFDINRSIMPDTLSLNKIYAGLNKKNSLIVAMIDYGTCSIENIQPSSETCIDAIRVIFKKHLRAEALDYCAKIKKLGYKVFAQLVSVTSYNEDEMRDLIHLANLVKPDTISIVDTYGLMHQNDLQDKFEFIDKYLDEDISIGYHGHNNFQMGYANCISMISYTSKTKRNLVIDGTVYGMGKGAGNTPTELIAMHINNVVHKKYNIDQILELIDSVIMDFYGNADWGYSLFYFIAASNDCHPNYVFYLLMKKTLSVSSINEILKNLSKDKALIYDEEYIENKYLDYQKNQINDSLDIEKLKNMLFDKKVLLIGPEKLDKKKIIFSSRVHIKRKTHSNIN
jgi:4-hydroxy 2-oxovalerate aldolase